MNKNKLALYLLCLGVGAALATLVRSGTTPSKASESHSRPEFVLPSGSSVHGQVAALSERLEDGTVRLRDILEVTTLLLDALRVDLRETVEEIKLPLVVDKTTIGYLRMPEAEADGTRRWIFEVTFNALPRHAGIADYTDVTMTYYGAGAEFTTVTASSETFLHRRASTITAIGSRAYVTGGWFSADATTSKTCPLTLTVDSTDPTRASWTSAVGNPAQGEDVLTPTACGPVAGTLFSL